MKKKLFLGLFSVIFLLTATACNKRTVPENTPPENTNPSSQSAGEEVSSDELYSDETKLVYEMGNTKYVFYYSGETITGYKTFTDYQDEETAQGALEFLKSQNITDTSKYYTSGKYLVNELDESEYANMTTTDIRNAYANTKEVTK